MLYLKRIWVIIILYVNLELEFEFGMAYQAIYRKFRPKDFSEVKGQDHIVTTLKNQLISDKIGHAYLFCGTRGTGKTSVAKILAKAVNCENLKDGNPCNECPSCRAINNGSSIDVVEIDAASNSGVENVRQIKEEVQYSPANGKYKVYILDEVHMLSSSAFNALLKTLEEPPSYVIFILATTEAHSVLPTIVSRCQRYDFKRIEVDTIVARLKEICEIEHYSVEEAGLKYIARLADGAFRDALSLLDKCVSYKTEGSVTYDEALEILGAVDTTVYEKMVENVAKQDAAACIETLDEVIMQGRDVNQFVSGLIWYYRNLMLLKASKGAKLETLDLSGEQMNIITKLADTVTLEEIMRSIRLLSDLSSQIRFSSNKRVLTEISLIKLTRPDMDTDTASLSIKIANLEKRLAGIESGAVKLAKADGFPGLATQDVAKDEVETPKKPAVLALPKDVKEVADNWFKIEAQLKEEKNQILYELYKNVKLEPGEGNVLNAVVDKDDTLTADYVEKEESIKKMEEVIEKVTGKIMKIKFLSVEKKTFDNKLDIKKIQEKVDYTITEED